MDKRPMSMILMVAAKGAMGIVEIFAAGALFVVLTVIRVLLPNAWIWGVYTVGIHFVLFLLVLGIVKIALAIGVWRRSMLIRNIGLLFFIAASVLSLYHLVTDFSVWKLIVFCFDGTFAFYFWRVLPKHLQPVADVDTPRKMVN